MLRAILLATIGKVDQVEMAWILCPDDEPGVSVIRGEPKSKLCPQVGVDLILAESIVIVGLGFWRNNGLVPLTPGAIYERPIIAVADTDLIGCCTGNKGCAV